MLGHAGCPVQGPLPSFEKRLAWRALKTLDLSRNSIWGGLPASWLGAQKPLRKVAKLDLSDNHLGLDSEGIPLPKEEWCQSEEAAGQEPGTGWCPEAPHIKGTVSSLSWLSLAENYLSGGVLPMLCRAVR